MSVIKWIHFSDLHFNKTNINTRLLRDSIRSFLTENQIECDYAFFSGDLRNAPDHCFQKDSVKYLRELCEAVNVSPDHFFMIPGNHDVDREIEKRDQAVKRILNNHGSEKGYYNTADGKIEESDLQDIKTGQKQYLEIIEEFYEGNPDRIEKYKGTSHFLVETEDFNIIHLDSTLVYTKGQEESLVIGTDLLYDLLEKVNQHKYTIILTHYPFDALKAEEKTQVCRILEQFGVQIWMSGHLHDVLVQQHRKAFYEFQCGNLLTDGGIPNILIGQLDIESGEGEVRAYMWQQNGGWTLNRFLDRMSKVDKSLYCFELSPTEFMKRSGKVSVKETDRPEISELRSLAVEKIEKMYEDRHTILKDCIYGDLKYPVVVKAWTPAEADTIYVIDKLERNSYCLEKMEKWIQILDEYEENYRRIVQRSSIGILQLVVEEACSDEQKEYYEKDFRDICEKFYRNRELEIDIIERDTLEKNTNLEKDNKIYISSISVLPVKKEMIYAMDIGIVAQVSATRPVLVGDYDSIQEINRQIEQYYQKTWDEWKEHIECHQNDEMMLERITSQPNKNEISDGTLTDELTYEVTHNDSSILSILFDRYLYLGGAHGTPLRKSMVVNLNTGEPIKLHEILPVSFSELMDILRNQLYVRYGSEDTEVLEVCYKNIVDLYHEVDEFKFYIRYSALYIYFDVYEISSYSMGYVDLYIMDLQEFLSERCDISECDIVRKQAIFEKIFKPNIR